MKNHGHASPGRAVLIANALVAFSVDGEAATAEFAEEHHIPIRMGHSADVDAVVGATGAYDMNVPPRGHFLATTGFVLAPD